MARVCAAFALVILMSSESRAQDAAVDNTAAARALFQQGLELLEAERWEAAADRFQRANVLRPSPQITYNLTTALVELGRLVRATELLRQVTLDPTAEPAVRDAAADRRAALQPRLARLTIDVDEELGDVELFLNEQLLQDVLVGVPFPVDPGAHDVTARRDGEVQANRRVTLADGEARVIHLGPPSTGGDLAGLATTDGEHGERSSVARRWWFWTLIGVAVVGTGLGLGLGLGLQEQQGDPIGGLGGTVFVGGSE